MNKIVRNCISVGALLFCSACCLAQTEASVYTPGVHADGVTYFLPKTLLEVKLEVEKVSYTPGEFCHYANKYLRLQGISDKPDTYWNIKSVEVVPVGVPDAGKGFTVKLKDKTVAPLVELTRDGLLKSVNYPPAEPVAKAVSLPVDATNSIDPKGLLGEEILSATSTAKMAELVAKEIYSIRESRNSIIRGQADNMPKDGEALKIVLKNLEEQDRALTSMFEGVTRRESKQYLLKLTPADTVLVKQVLFRFSKKRGVVAADDLGGAPIYYDMQNLTSLPTPDVKALKKAKRPDGIVYHLPGKVGVKIYRGTEVYSEGEYPVAQLGNLEVLADDLFDKNATTKVSFDVATGAILRIDRE